MTTAPEYLRRAAEIMSYHLAIQYPIPEPARTRLVVLGERAMAARNVNRESADDKPSIALEQFEREMRSVLGVKR